MYWPVIPRLNFEMTSGSLRLRLLAASAATITLVMIIAIVVMSWIFSRHLEHNLSRELTRDGLQLVASLHVADNGRIVLDALPNDARFELPGSGRYWQISGSAHQERSLSLWDESLPSADANNTRWSTHKAPGPFGQYMLWVERWIHSHEGQYPVRVQVAQDMAELHAARRAFRAELALFLTVLGLALVAAAWVQVSLGLKPLAQVRCELEVMRKRSTARLGEGHPREILPLVEAINQLAIARESDLIRARKRAADLAHSLKTPLAALAAQNRRAREAGATEAANGLDRAIAAVAAAVEAELARSRAAAMRSRQQSSHSYPAVLAERVIEVIERTERGAKVVFENHIDPALALPLAADDLMELLGALLENAVRFARRRVCLSSLNNDTDNLLMIEDDGHGLDISDEQALMRGGRLDEASQTHHGLGLAIARDMVEASQGHIRLEHSALGGLKVLLSWPKTA